MNDTDRSVAQASASTWKAELLGGRRIHHGELARMLLDQIDTLAAQIATLTSRIERLLAAMPDKRSRGDPTTGGDRDTTARPTNAALLSRSSGSTRSPA